MTSNQIALTGLATRIEAEHQAAYGNARIALEHAAECGRLLIEAKAQASHGEWLPWLNANTTVSARQSQKYMRLANNWEQIEAKCEPDSHLTLTEAVTLLATPKEIESADIPEEEHPNAWDVSGPLTDHDFEKHSDFPYWLQWKLSHLAELPKSVRVALSLADDYAVSALALCPPPDIEIALKRIAAVAKGEVPLPLATNTTDALQAWTAMELTAQRILVALFDEVRARKNLSDERGYQRAESAHEKLVKVLSS